MGKKKAEPEASKAVVMTPGRYWSGPKILIVVIVLAVIGGLAGWYIWSGRESEQPSDTAVTDTKEYRQKVDASDKLRGSQDYDQAKQVWQEYINDDASNAEKYKAYIQIGSLDETKGDYQAALRNYREAEKLGSGEWRAEHEAIARCSEKLGDKQTALTYYQKTLDVFPGGQEYDSDRRYYQRKIDSLKQALGAN